jgi:hypothetical protein
MIVVTTNGEINRSMQLVMGRGAALEATQRIPNIAKLSAGKIVIAGCTPMKPAIYGFLEVLDPYREGKSGFGLFQVKRRWSDKADLDLIAQSAEALKEYCERNPKVAIRMNYPGIGNGKLRRQDVEPLLVSLPDQVTICIKE